MVYTAYVLADMFEFVRYEYPMDILMDILSTSLCYVSVEYIFANIIHIMVSKLHQGWLKMYTASRMVKTVCLPVCC